jgi:ribonuclease Z
MTFEITILGCGAATPTTRHFPSAQVVNMHEKLFLVDCGEGTQIQLRRMKFRVQKINHIFISHLHGDHFFGLIGFLSSLHLLGRQVPIQLYGPAPLEKLIQMHLEISATILSFEIHFHATNANEMNLLFEDKTLEVYSIPLKHRIETCGFLFKEKIKSRKIIQSYVDEFQLIPSQILALKNGQDILTDHEEVIKSAEATLPPPESRSYAYCSDTAFFPAIVPMIKNVDLLYHESTFLESENERAKETFHSTAKEAAEIARLASAKALVIGHYSSRYKTEAPFLEEAQSIFAATSLANEGRVFQVGTDYKP